MTEQDLRNEAAKLKAIYAQNLNTTRNNSKAEYEADKTSFTNDANNQLGEQKSTTNTAVADADINAFNNAKKLREMAASGGYSGGGELFSGVIQNEQQKGNQIGNANNNFAKYKRNWDDKLNQYNTKWNNNLNKLNTETDNNINEYNVKTDMDYNNKIDSLRQQMAAAAASAARARASSSAKSAKLTTSDKTQNKADILQAYTSLTSGKTANYPAASDWLRKNQDSIIESGGQAIWNQIAEDFASKYAWVGKPNSAKQQEMKTYYDTRPQIANRSVTLPSGKVSSPVQKWLIK